MSRPMLLPSAMSGSMVLLHLRSVLMPVAMSPQKAMWMFTACVVT